MIKGNMMPLKLTKKDQEIFDQSLNELRFQNLDDYVQNFVDVYNKIEEPIKNPKYRNRSKEDFFYYLTKNQNYELLCLGYHFALKENSPEILLKSFHTFNLLESKLTLDSGYDHCTHWLDCLMCYAGNNKHLIDLYLPPKISLSKNGHRFNKVVTNLIIALRQPEKKGLAIEEVENFLTKKNPKFDVAVVNSLKSILENNTEELSENLVLITKLHKKSTSLHGFKNRIGKFLPFISYGVLSLAHHSSLHGGVELSKVSKESIWWQDFIAYNEKHRYTETEPLVNFPSLLSFINN